MADSYLTTYQIALFAVFGVNVVFWLLLLCLRFCCLNSMTTNLTRCRRLLNSLTNFSFNINQMHDFTIRGAVMRINSDLPPPYEQAIKFPSLSSITGQITRANGNSIYIISPESEEMCFTGSPLEPAPSYFESQIFSSVLPVAPHHHNHHHHLQPPPSQQAPLNHNSDQTEPSTSTTPSSSTSSLSGETSTTSSSTSSSSQSSNESKSEQSKRIKSSSIQRSFSFGDIESQKKLQRSFNPV